MGWRKDKGRGGCRWRAIGIETAGRRSVDMGRSLDVQYMWQHTNMTRELRYTGREGLYILS